MKKFISMVLAAAMVVSTVPATAFALDVKGTTAKVVGSLDLSEADAAKVEKGYTPTGVAPDYIGGTGKEVKDAPELQLTIKDADYSAEDTAPTKKFKVKLENAKFVDLKNAPTASSAVKVVDKAVLDPDQIAATKAATVTGTQKMVASIVEDKDGTNTTAPKIKQIEVLNNDADEIEVTVEGVLEKGDVIKVGLYTVLTRVGSGSKAKVSVDSDDLDIHTDDMIFATVQDNSIKASVKKVADITEEGVANLERELTIESKVGDFAQNQKFELKLSSGFTFNYVHSGTNYTADFTKGEREATIKVTATNLDKITVDAKDIEILADTAKVGTECKLTVRALKEDTVSGSFADNADAVVIAKVVADEITVTVDKDEDVPVIYSGVNVKNDGITDDSDHKALKVTIKEPTTEVLDAKKALTMELPEGVYVTDVTVGKKSFGATDQTFKDAYKKGNYESFEFVRRALEATSADKKDDPGELQFTLELVAEPGFTGDVNLKVEGAGMSKAQEVKIAKFVAPYTVEAAKNDLIIDYRNTKVPTNVVVKEAEDGLWKKNSEFKLQVEKIGELEKDATYKVDEKSGMEVKTLKKDFGFQVDKESSGSAAEVTISDISLYMQRSLPAGSYDLKAEAMGNSEFMATKPYGDTKTIEEEHYNNKGTYYHAVKEGFINIVTAGKDKDNTFTTKVVVPIGESKMYAGDKEIALDVPAYLSAEGYTMLPVRAVATALGVDNSSVRWDGATKTVTIMYGQRIITMVAGQKVITVNGNTIPSATTVQIKNSRTFLSLRDLGTALNVTDVTWDAATKTATLNGNQGK